MTPGSLNRTNSGPDIGLGFDAPRELLDDPSLNFTHVYPYLGEPSNSALPPSLWMSPVSTVVNTTSSMAKPSSTHLQRSNVSSDSTPFAQSPVSPTSPSIDSKSTLFTDIFSEELFGLNRVSLSPQATSPFTSPRMSGSPALQFADFGPDTEKMAKEDPLATQVWRMYARTKANLPHAQRMENLTWRMMALALKKKKEEEEEASKGNRATITPASAPNPETTQSDTLEIDSDKRDSAMRNSDERGRRIDKGKAKIRVVGFEGTNQDGFEEPE